MCSCVSGQAPPVPGTDHGHDCDRGHRPDQGPRAHRPQTRHVDTRGC